MQDPYAILASSIGNSVTVHVLNNERVFGTLLSVDDHGNTLLQNWKMLINYNSDDDTVHDDNEQSSSITNIDGRNDSNQKLGNVI